MKKQLNMKIIRSLLVCTIILGVLTTLTAFSFAWYTGVVTSKENRLTTDNVNVRLLTTNSPIKIISPDGSQINSPEHPKYISDIFLNNNNLIFLNDESNKDRKFFEIDGKTGIEGAKPNFKFQRPIIVTNDSEFSVSYTIDFVCREIQKEGLSSSIFFNYTKLGDDIPNECLVSGDKTELKPQFTVENIAYKIKKIGEEYPFSLKPHSSHIYIVDMGILPSAGNSSIGCGIELDIVLASSQGANKVHTISNQESLEKAIVNNMGGETFMLTNPLTIDKKLCSNNVFNLDLNGYTLTFEKNSSLEIFYPITQASIDIGSDKGGSIINANSLLFHGHKNKSVLNWYTDITNLEKPAICNDVLVRTKKIEKTTSSETSEPSNEDNDSDYINYDEISSYCSIEGRGTQSEPFIINSNESFKCFVEQENSSETSWYKLTTDIGYIKNIPQKLLTKQANIIFNENVKIHNLNIILDKEPSDQKISLNRIRVFNIRGSIEKNSKYIKDLKYIVK